MRRIDSERGWTLAEVIVYLALAVLLLAAISHIFTYSLSSWVDDSRQAEAQAASRMALDAMVRELRQAAKLEYDREKPSEIVYVDKDSRKRVRFYHSSGVLYRDSDLIPQPVAGVPDTLRVKNISFSVLPDLSVVDIELTVSWYGWNRTEKIVCLKTTVYCVNCRQS